MEVGRVEYCRQTGISYAEMERQDGILLTVAEANCRYLAPALYDQEIVVKTWIEQAHTRMATFAYEMRGEDGRRLATGTTKHVFCGRDLRPTRLPAQYWPIFGVAPRG